MKQALMDARDQALLEGRPIPVIRSDRLTLGFLAQELAQEIGCRVTELMTRDPKAPYLFDGIRFEVG